MSWRMSDDKIAAALSQTCCVCGQGSGEECLDPQGVPLVESSRFGVPVHARRLDA